MEANAAPRERVVAGTHVVRQVSVAAEAHAVQTRVVVIPVVEREFPVAVTGAVVFQIRLHLRRRRTTVFSGVYPVVLNVALLACSAVTFSMGNRIVKHLAFINVGNDFPYTKSFFPAGNLS